MNPSHAPSSDLAPGEPEEMMLGIVMADVLRLMRQDFAGRTRDVPLPPALHRLLLYVQRRPGARQVELAEWLDVTPVTVGRMIDRLERQNLVRRESHPADRRASCIYIGEGAHRLLDQLNRRANETRLRAVAGLSAQQRRELVDTLMKLRANLGSPASLRASTAEPKP